MKIPPPPGVAHDQDQARDPKWPKSPDRPAGDGSGGADAGPFRGRRRAAEGHGQSAAAAGAMPADRTGDVGRRVERAGAAEPVGAVAAPGSAAGEEAGQDAPRGADGLLLGRRRHGPRRHRNPPSQLLRDRPGRLTRRGRWSAGHSIRTKELARSTGNRAKASAGQPAGQPALSPANASQACSDFAAATTASTVMPKWRKSWSAGADAPNRSMPTTAPSRPTNCRQ